VLLFRGQSFSQEDLVRVTPYFGEIAPLSRPPKFFPKGYSRLLPNIMMISNIRENGETNRRAARRRDAFPSRPDSLRRCRTTARCSIRSRSRTAAATRCSPVVMRPTTRSIP